MTSFLKGVQRRNSNWKGAFLAGSSAGHHNSMPFHSTDGIDYLPCSSLLLILDLKQLFCMVHAGHGEES